MFFIKFICTFLRSITSTVTFPVISVVQISYYSVVNMSNYFLHSCTKTHSIFVCAKFNFNLERHFLHSLIFCIDSFYNALTDHIHLVLLYVNVQVVAWGLAVPLLPCYIYNMFYDLMMVDDVLPSNLQESDEKKLLDDRLDAEKRRMQRQHDKDSEEIRRNFERKKETLSEQLEDEVRISVCTPCQSIMKS